MYVCELMFGREDPHAPGYSLYEVDYYAWIPARFHRHVDDHRLSLRKNLVSGEFEVYRKYHYRGLEAVIASGTLEMCLEVANREAELYHGEREPDRACRHTPPETDGRCREFLKEAEHHA